MNYPSKEIYTFLLYEEDPDGRSGKITRTPIAIFSGNSKEETTQGLLHIIAKHLANGEYTKIAEFEAKVAENIEGIKEAVDTDNPNIAIVIDNTFFFIQQFEIDRNCQTILPPGSRRSTLVHFNEETGTYADVCSYPIDNLPTNTYEIEILGSDANPSPFLSASPFVVRGSDMYAIDSETGTASGPYQKADYFGGYYLVYANRNEKTAGGILSAIGKVIADCVYDKAYNQNGYAVLEKAGKLGFYTPYEGILIPCEYDDLEFPDTPDEAIIATKDGVRGLVATDSSFHPLSNVTDPSLIYL